MPLSKPVSANPSRQAKKRAVNLSLSADVLAAARALNINVSQVCDSHLREVVLTVGSTIAIPGRLLKERVTNLEDEHSRIVAAIDFLFQGY
jgi:hypothetical protein